MRPEKRIILEVILLLLLLLLLLLSYWKLLADACQIKILDFSLGMSTLNDRNCPSARRDSAANAIDSGTDIFSGRSI
jgi:hypothetical protein